ncbi:hypothetical protein P7K49_002072, partial [Saguinus oedipus]
MPVLPKVPAWGKVGPATWAGGAMGTERVLKRQGSRDQRTERRKREPGLWCQNPAGLTELGPAGSASRGSTPQEKRRGRDETGPRTRPVGPGGERGRGPGIRERRDRWGCARARGPSQGGAPVASGTTTVSASGSPFDGRRVFYGNQRRSIQKDSSRPGPRPKHGSPVAHLNREQPQEPEPRSIRVAASTTAAMLSLHPLVLSSLPLPPMCPAPSTTALGVRARASGARSGSGGERLGGAAAAERREGGGQRGPRPGRSQGHGAAAAGLGRCSPPGPAAMSGYPRRSGATPLSRARCIVIPDGERGRGRVQRSRWAAAAPAR